jgi:hypothetical protein
MAIKYINIFQSNALQKLQIGLKINHLATNWFENKPSGNPVHEPSSQRKPLLPKW